MKAIAHESRFEDPPFGDREGTIASDFIDFDGVTRGIQWHEDTMALVERFEKSVRSAQLRAPIELRWIFHETKNGGHYEAKAAL